MSSIYIYEDIEAIMKLFGIEEIIRLLTIKETNYLTLGEFLWVIGCIKWTKALPKCDLVLSNKQIKIHCR